MKEENRMFKVGDLVRVRSDLKEGRYSGVYCNYLMLEFRGKKFRIGKIIDGYSEPHYELDDSKAYTWDWTADMLELVIEMITVEEFKQGKIGVLICNDNDNDKETFDKFAKNMKWSSGEDVNDFTPSLKEYYIYCDNNGRLKFCAVCFANNNKNINQLALIQQLELPPEYYNGKIVCIKSSNDFTVGKIYNVVDGTFKDEHGYQIHNLYMMKRISTLEEWNENLKNSQFIAVVEEE